MRRASHNDWRCCRRERTNFREMPRQRVSYQRDAENQSEPLISENAETTERVELLEGAEIRERAEFPESAGRRASPAHRECRPEERTTVAERAEQRVNRTNERADSDE